MDQASHIPEQTKLTQGPICKTGPSQPLETADNRIQYGPSHANLSETNQQTQGPVCKKLDQVRPGGIADNRVQSVRNGPNQPHLQEQTIIAARVHFVYKLDQARFGKMAPGCGLQD